MKCFLTVEEAETAEAAENEQRGRHTQYMPKKILKY